MVRPIAMPSFAPPAPRLMRRIISRSLPTIPIAGPAPPPPPSSSPNVSPAPAAVQSCAASRSAPEAEP
jgi:hypothetical protein